MRIRQIIAASRRSGWSVALTLGGLLMPLPILHASAAHAPDTRAPHAHHGTLAGSGSQSAGRAPAHILHEAVVRPAHAAEDTTSRRGGRSNKRDSSERSNQSNRSEREDRSDREDRSSAHASASTRKGMPAPKHAKNSDDAARSARSQGGRKRHKEPPVDEAKPVSRAQLQRGKRGARAQAAEQLASGRAAQETYAPLVLSSPVRRHAIRLGARIPTRSTEEDAQIGSGLTTAEFLRDARHGSAPAAEQPAPAPEAFASTPVPSPAPATTGVSHPDDEERPPVHSVAALEHRAATSIHNAEASLAASVHLPRSAPAVLANTAGSSPASVAPVASVASVSIATAATESAPPATPVVEGFGAEVDFRAAATKPSRPVSPVLPRESPAQQERELRAAADVAAQPMFIPLYARDGQLIVPPPLKGSHDILVHQNQMADDAGLTRIQDDADLDRMRRGRLLVDFPESASLRVSESLPENRRCARPWTVQFATDIARAYYARFGQPLQVNSAVRTVAYQLRLIRVNGNAAGIEGESASPHLTGQALDFGKRGMSVAEIAWMRSYLLPLIDAGKIDVEEEFLQACFHISVYASYAPALRAPRVPAVTAVAQVNRGARTHAAASEYGDNLQ